MKINEAIQEYLLDHKAKGSRPKTIWWYKTTLGFLLVDRLDQPVSCLTVFAINKALNRDVKQSSLANYERALRGFCSWLQAVQLLDKNPFAGRKRIRERFEPKQILSLEEIEKLLEVAKLEKRTRYRNQAILLLFLGTGLRSSELARIRLADIDWESGQIKIEGKTGNSTLPMGRKIYKAIRKYITHERKTSDPHLFVYQNKPVNHASLSRLMNRLGKRAGIERPIGVHILRHTFATMYLRNGGDTFTLQRILRHSSPLMTQRYLHFVTGDLQQKLEHFSPLSKII